jgi:hypothetical protein
LENGTFPTGKDTLGDMSASNSKLADDLLQNCSPYSFKIGNKVIVFDDFGDKPNKDKPNPANMQEIHYVHLYNSEKRDIFMLMSMGKDGAWGGGDDVVFLPFGMPKKSIKAGSYLCSTNASGTITGELEPLAQ